MTTRQVRMVDVFSADAPLTGNPLAVVLDAGELTTELPFAGHPTLGTSRAWLGAGGVPRTPGRVVQECRVGLVPVRIEEDALALAAMGACG